MQNCWPYRSKWEGNLVGNMKNAAGQLECINASDHGNYEVSSSQLDRIVGGIDYGRWTDKAVENEVSRLAAQFAKQSNSPYQSIRESAFNRLYAAETELIKRKIYGDYSADILNWHG